jgi:hypothetical protein
VDRQEVATKTGEQMTKKRDNIKKTAAEETTNTPEDETTKIVVSQTTKTPEDETTKIVVDQTTKKPEDETTKIVVDQIMKTPEDETTKIVVDQIMKTPEDETRNLEHDETEDEDEETPIPKSGGKERKKREATRIKTKREKTKHRESGCDAASLWWRGGDRIHTEVSSYVFGENDVTERDDLFLPITFLLCCPFVTLDDSELTGGWRGVDLHPDLSRLPAVRFEGADPDR